MVNPNGREARGADVLVDAQLSGPTMTVVAATERDGMAEDGPELPVRRRADGAAIVEVRDLPPAEVLVIANDAALHGRRA